MNLLGIIFVYAIYIWLQESVPEPERIAALRENTYVRVYGTVRSFGGKRNVTAFKMVPVMDMNEVTYHILEVTHSHLALSKHAASVCLFCFLHFWGANQVKFSILTTANFITYVLKLFFKNYDWTLSFSQTTCILSLPLLL